MDKPAIDPAALALLREIVEETARTGEFPRKDAVAGRRAHESWRTDELMDDLFEHGLLGSADDSRVFATLEGLEACDTDAARAERELAKEVYRRLRDAHWETPGSGRTVEELARQGDTLMSPATVERQLVLLERFRHATNSNDNMSTFYRLRSGGGSREPFAEAPRAEPDEKPDALEPITLKVWNFRGLRHAVWDLDDVCLLAGPNGSGKSSLLEALFFLRTFFSRGLAAAVQAVRGPSGLRNIYTGPNEPIVLALEVGALRWSIRLGEEGGGLHEHPGEVVSVGDEAVVRRTLYSPHWYLGGVRRNAHELSCLRVAYESGTAGTERLAGLVDVIRRFRYYAGYDLEGIRANQQVASGKAILRASGLNLYSVLRNWQTAPRRFDDQFDWVMRKLRLAFPGVIDHIEFETVGQAIAAQFYPAGARDPEHSLPMHLASDGMLVGLLHLTAVAGAPEGAVIAIDEIENQLHPHAIRSILTAMRERAEERSLTIILTTHSPVVMNEFRKTPEQFFVTETGHDKFPVPLDEIHDPEWLAHFSLGDLYDREQFGAPGRGKQDARDADASEPAEPATNDPEQ